MIEYRRFQFPGATWFFSVNLVERHGNRLLTDRIDLLRMAFAHVQAHHPYEIDAIVVLPEHLHCVLTLPDGDSDFSTRWGLIKAYFSRHIAKGERISQSREKRGKRGLYPKGTSGSGDFGNTLLGMKPIIGSISNTFIGTRSGMAGLELLKIGPIQVFMVM
ncbi:hypothetical protein [Methylomonas sp.]|jgi:putative transposase|uniref:REP-associated tyrosine transposase n=1 Tax=Methylomonas sp. TaxID=418 RepID=UPI00341C3CD7